MVCEAGLDGVKRLPSLDVPVGTGLDASGETRVLGLDDPDGPEVLEVLLGLGVIVLPGLDGLDVFVVFGGRGGVGLSPPLTPECFPSGPAISHGIPTVAPLPPSPPLSARRPPLSSSSSGGLSGRPPDSAILRNALDKFL